VTVLLPILQVDKPWGSAHLPAPFATPEGRRIGEIWFEPPACLPQLLVKYIFATDKLSVQVHPNDDQTLARGLGRQGKEECWLVIAAEPGARLGIGFRQPISAQAMRDAALDGSIEDLLVWHPVVAGDFFYIPANTVHAIGAGVSVIEIQQNSDITYRLFDYGRPRELHLDDGLAVALGQVYDLARWHRDVPPQGTVRLVDGPFFRLDRVQGTPDASTLARFGEGALLLVPVAGDVSVAGETVPPGACALVGDATTISADADALLLLTQPVGR